MIIFLAFIAIFLISLGIYHATQSFKFATGIPLAIYIIGIAYYFFTSHNHQAIHREIQLLFFFGTPMVFFASLLAPYIYIKYFSNNEAQTASKN